MLLINSVPNMLNKVITKNERSLFEGRADFKNVPNHADKPELF
jgi:hypothetical protein